MASLPADAEAAIARAQLALECAQRAALCMLRCELCKGARATAATQRCVALLCKPLAGFARCFALTPLPFPGRRRCSPTCSKAIKRNICKLTGSPGPECR